MNAVVLRWYRCICSDKVTQNLQMKESVSLDVAVELHLVFPFGVIAHH
jgi:hypothetical protein